MKLLIPDYLVRENKEKIKALSSNGIIVEEFYIRKNNGIFHRRDDFELYINGKIAREKLEDVKVLIAPSYLDRIMTGFLVSKLPGLEWIHSVRTGVEELLIEPIRRQSIMLTSAHLCSESVAEFILALVLSITKRIPQHIKLQKKGAWKFVPSGQLKGKKAGILGFGSIGKAVAKRLKENDMMIWAWDKVRHDASELIDRFSPYENLDEVLKNCDFIIITLPLTSDTHHLISQREIDLIKKKAWIINIGRGGLIDGKALYESLESKKIGGVCLDMLDSYLNKKIKKLSMLDNLILTHHSSFYYPGYNSDVMDVFSRELANFINNKPLENIIDAEKGY